MFGSGKKVTGFSEQVETIIGKDTQFKGSITAGGTIRIDGQHEGDVTTNGDVVIGESGVVKAQIQARSAMVAGSIYGNVDISEKLELLPTAKLYGDIKVGILSIAEGALFKGVCEMRHSSENELGED